MIKLTQEVRPGLEPHLSPKIIQYYRLLQQPLTELEQSIRGELEQNPALELKANPHCPSCQAEMIDGLCPECGYRRADRGEPLELWPYSQETHTPAPWGRVGEEASDPLQMIASPVSLQDHLKSQFRSLAREEDIEAGEILIDCLDDNGYLEDELELLAEGLGIPLERMEAILHALQQLDPPGVGARNLRECLLIQIARLPAPDPDSAVASLARSIMEGFWEDFQQQRYEPIAHELRVGRRRIQQTVDFIGARLNPFPGRAFRSPVSAMPTVEGPERPDIVILARRDAQGRVEHNIQIPSDAASAVQLNRFYLRLWQEMRKQPERFSEDERSHVQQHIARARAFLSNLTQRRDTVRRILEVVIQNQQPFLLSGPEFLRPLTRRRVAGIVGYHESTVGRAISGKWVLLPSGRWMRCEEFFDGSRSAKEHLRKILAEEDSSHPLSDEQIAHRLEERGVAIARRTVTKYRRAMRIPTARRRRRY